MTDATSPLYAYARKGADPIIPESCRVALLTARACRAVHYDGREYVCWLTHTDSQHYMYEFHAQGTGMPVLRCQLHVRATALHALWELLQLPDTIYTGLVCSLAADLEIFRLPPQITLWTGAGESREFFDLGNGQYQLKLAPESLPRLLCAYLPNWRELTIGRETPTAQTPSGATAVQVAAQRRALQISADDLSASDNGSAAP